MRSPVMGSPFWLWKAFPRAVMMFAGFCGAGVAGDFDEAVVIAYLLCFVGAAKSARGSSTTYVGMTFYIQESLL